MTAYALGSEDAGFPVLAESDGLVSSIPARNITAPAAYAHVVVDDGIDHRVAVRLRREYETGDAFAYKFLQLFDPPSCHIGSQAQDQVIDYPVSIFHHGGAQLDILAAQLDELERIPPCIDPADAGKLGSLQDGILRDFKDEAQCNGLDCRP